MMPVMITRFKRRINFRDRHHHIISRFFFFINDFGNVTDCSNVNNCSKTGSGSTFRRDLIRERFGVGRSGFCIVPVGIRLMLQHQVARNYSSTDNKGQSAIHGSDQKRKEVTSLEDCHQSVEGLKMTRIKKKQQLETQIMIRPLVTRFCTRMSEIGPVIGVFASMSMEDWSNKLIHWKSELISTLQHYWLGLKLLLADVRISSRLLLKLASGKSLTRRERKQLTRTTADIFRLVPFAVFIIVPFMEFFLPIFLKLFPNMLPSTFQDKLKEQESMKRKLNARIEYAKFLQDTAQEMAKEVQKSRTGDIKQTAKNLDEFLNKARTGDPVLNEEILSFAKLFKDELTLENIGRSRLVNMCKYMGIQPYLTDNYLRYMLRQKLREIKEDDILIQAEGVESLSESELRQACRERGYLGLLSIGDMHQQLRDWLDLSLNHDLPPSLLILSRAFTVSGKLRPEDVFVATLTSLPDEVVDNVGIGLPSEDSISDRQRKLKILQTQEKLIKEEEKLMKDKLKESIGNEDLALKGMPDSTMKEDQDMEKAKTFVKHEQLNTLSRALVVLASASSVSNEREKFLSLVNKEIQLYNSILEKEGTDGEAAAKKAYVDAREESNRALEAAAGDKTSTALINKVDAMLKKLEKEIDDVETKIGNRWRLLDRDNDGKVTSEELVASAALYLKDTLGKVGIEELINNLSKDKEGKILVEDIARMNTQVGQGMLKKNQVAEGNLNEKEVKEHQ